MRQIFLRNEEVTKYDIRNSDVDIAIFVLILLLPQLLSLSFDGMSCVNNLANNNFQIRQDNVEQGNAWEMDDIQRRSACKGGSEKSGLHR